MRQALASVAAVGGVAVLFATAARPTHAVQRSPASVRYTYCIETTTGVSMPPYVPSKTTTGPCATIYVAAPGG